MAYKKFVFFPTFRETKIAQEYDYNYQKAVAFATISGVDLAIIKSENLHQLNDGKFLLENYVVQNNIEVPDDKLYREQLLHWKNTYAWSDYYRLGNEYCFLKDHSDASYNDVREVDTETLIRLDNEGNDIVNPNL